ncbi:MAG: hypothetical protein HOP21_00560 [Methylotenera sp.]|nr:hypothetical protein [Methylotenera sp.]
MTTAPSLQAGSVLCAQIHEYNQWRETLIACIDAYSDWLALRESTDSLQDLRLYDIKQILKKDQLVLAFLAEFSRGKTETINALFFSDFNQRLLPSEPGRTTMCPTEIFWDENDEPCIRLLPIDTRKSADALSYLKTNPNVWQKFRLDTSSPTAMKETLKELVKTKEVDLNTAKKMGLWDESDPSMQRMLKEKGVVQVPVWRHALINYPHPLLKNGLVVIDTPGLNTMGAEPELTLSIIPSAQAILFLTATDTGITKSDMEIWTDYVYKSASHKLVVLNKIDILWGGLESEDEVTALIQKQIQSTSQALNLNAQSVFAISAQKALVAKIKQDAVLLEQSRIGQLENALAKQLITSKHEVLGRAVVTECANMMKSSRKLVQIQANNLKSQYMALRQMQKDSQASYHDILERVVEERKRYEASTLTFNQGSEKIKRLGEKLFRHLSLGYLNTTLAQVKQDMGESWTTVGLNKSMRTTTRLAIELAQEINLEAANIKNHADNLYHLFWSKHGFDKTEAQMLSMTDFTLQITSLEKATNDFCTNPANIVLEKRFLIRRFYLGLGVQIEKIFEQASADCNRWVQDVLGDLKSEINAHKNALDKQVEALMESHNNADLLAKNVADAEKQFVKCQEESNQLDAVLLKLLASTKLNPQPLQNEPLTPTAPPSKPENHPDYFATTVVLEAPIITLDK